jgi:hypothetical protein
MRPNNFELEEFRPDILKALWLGRARVLRSENRATGQGEQKACGGSSENSEPGNKLPKSLNPEVGVAFSGGGVRSATFNPGLLH